MIVRELPLISGRGTLRVRAVVAPIPRADNGHDEAFLRDLLLPVALHRTKSAGWRASYNATMMRSIQCPGEEGVMPRRPVSVTETKAEKFQRLASLRTNLILDGLRKLGSLSNKNHYDYSEDGIRWISSILLRRRSRMPKSRFLGRTRRDFRL
jgi:hypothetical protein